MVAGGGPSDIFVFATQLTLSHRDRHVAFDERRAPLTRTEFDLLANLMKIPGRVFRREELLARVWSSPRIHPRTVDVTPVHRGGHHFNVRFANRDRAG